MNGNLCHVRFWCCNELRRIEDRSNMNTWIEKRWINIIVLRSILHIKQSLTQMEGSITENVCARYDLSKTIFICMKIKKDVQFICHESEAKNKL